MLNLRKKAYIHASKNNYSDISDFVLLLSGCLITSSIFLHVIMNNGLEHRYLVTAMPWIEIGVLLGINRLRVFHLKGHYNFEQYNQ